MKNIKTLALVAAAAMGFASCQKDVQEQVQPETGTVHIDFIAQSADTKTSVDTSGDVPVFSWNETETFAVLEQTDALASASSVTFAKEEGKAKITAEFDVNAGKSEYQYVAVYPASGYVNAASISEATLAIPAVQTMAEGSYDPAADLMVSEVVLTDAQPTDAQMVRFTRLAAVVKMSLKNFGVELGDKVQSVTFTAEGKTIAGNIVADLSSPHGFVAGAETSSSVTVNTASASDVYFTVLPAVLEAGDAYAVTVLTDKKLYVKQGVVAEDKNLVFESGMVTRFGVDMSGVAPSDKWVLVKDASVLKQGDIVTFAAKDYNYVIGKQANNYPLASQTEVIKMGDYLYHPVADANTSVDNRIQHFTLVQRDSKRVAFDFYNDVDYEGDVTTGFLFANGTNYSPKYQSYCDKNTLFDVTITDGVASVIATEIEKSYKYLRFYYNSSASSRRFDCTNSTPTGDKQICVYRLDGATGTIPVVAANVTVPDADEPVVIAEEGASAATPIEEVVFNYVGDWAVSATVSQDWMAVSYADGVLSYTAEPNTGAVREAVVTITATLEGQEDLTWTFNVLQKGVPQEVSIEEFITKEKDENVTYKITGRITEMTTSSSGTYKLSDEKGNIATVTYLYTDGGDKVYGDETIGLEVGDVMTVTTVVTSSTKGKGGSSSYHSIYKGHYGIKASAGIAADYTGGTVTIDVTTKSNGSITAPEAVEAVMEENDFAEFSYSGGDEATVTFPTENTTSDAREAVVTFTYGQTSVTVTAEQGVNPANKLGYELVTDASTLAVGDEVIVVAKNADKALACPTKTSDTKFPSTDIKKTGNVIYDIEDAGVQTFILESGVSDGTMAFKFTYKDETYYPYYSSGLKMRTSVNDAASWTISIGDDGDATVSTVSSSKDYLMKFNSAPASLTFTAYLSTAANATKAENAICIYKKQVKN